MSDAKLLIHHAKNCAAVKAVRDGRWETPWTGIPVDTKWLSKAGDKRGSFTPWLVIECNCINCRATKLVRAEAIAKIEP